MKALRNMAALLAALFMLSACSNGATTTVNGTPSAGNGVPAGPQTAGAGDDLLAFTAPLLSGGEIDGQSFRGKALALWFWAPW